MKEQTTHGSISFSLLFVSFALSGASSQAADNWLITAGGVGNDGASGVTRVPNGDIFITGSVGPAGAFETIQITNDLGNAFFLARYNASGELLWVTNASGNSASRGDRVYADGTGSAFVTAWHTNSLNLGNGVVVPLTGTQPGPWAKFLACYSAVGTASWAALADSVGIPVIQDPLGRVLAYSSTYTYLEDGTRVTDSILGMLKQESGMAPLVSWQLTNWAWEVLSGVAVQTNGQFWLSGRLGHLTQVVFSSQLSLQNTNTDVLNYLAKFSADGTPLSIIGDTNLPAGDLAVEGQGNLFIVGFQLPSTVRVYKYDSTARLLWERTWPGKLVSPTGAFAQTSFAVNGDGHMLVASYFGGAAVIRQLNPDGELVAQRILRTTAVDGISLAGIDVAPDGTVITAGSFIGRLTIDDVSVDAFGSDIFVARFHLLPVQSPILSWTRISDGVILTWPVGFVLQNTSSLNPVDWQDLAGSSPLTISTASSARFFRLRFE